jgi:hypothetical protein
VAGRASADTALVHAIESSSSRRYPMYWDNRSGRGTGAQELLAHRTGISLAASSADELFTELEASIVAQERLAEPPLTSAMADARLKRYLPDPLRRIDLHDLVMQRLDPIRHAVERGASHPWRPRTSMPGCLSGTVRSLSPC